MPVMRLARSTGSQIALPYKTTLAEVTITASIANSPIGTGRPTDWPTIWSRCDLAKRVKSGMFRASVAQKPTIAVSEGQKVAQNWPAFLPPSTNCDGALSRSPKPPALSCTQPSSTKQIKIFNGAV